MLYIYIFMFILNILYIYIYLQFKMNVISISHSSIKKRTAYYILNASFETLGFIVLKLLGYGIYQLWKSGFGRHVPFVEITLCILLRSFTFCRWVLVREHDQQVVMGLKKFHHN
ncbi:hypothetical protein AMTRI_Chr08g168610 [Amborella trichopoda]